MFLKFLEVILKVGNWFNVGIIRGDVKVFNFFVLRKFFDYKSSDGKIILFYFVVYEVVRNEGRRCVMNRINSLIRFNS